MTYKIKKVKYEYAKIGLNGKQTNIFKDREKIILEKRKNIKFYCIECKEELIAVLDHRTPHFKHKSKENSLKLDCIPERVNLLGLHQDFINDFKNQVNNYLNRKIIVPEIGLKIKLKNIIGDYDQIRYEDYPIKNEIFNTRSKTRKPDIVFLKDDKVVFVIEICYTNKVKEENRAYDYKKANIRYLEIDVDQKDNKVIAIKKYNLPNVFIKHYLNLFHEAKSNRELIKMKKYRNILFNKYEYSVNDLNLLITYIEEENKKIEKQRLENIKLKFRTSDLIYNLYNNPYSYDHDGFIHIEDLFDKLYKQIVKYERRVMNHSKEEFYKLNSKITQAMVEFDRIFKNRFTFDGLQFYINNYYIKGNDIVKLSGKVYCGKRYLLDLGYDSELNLCIKENGVWRKDYYYKINSFELEKFLLNKRDQGYKIIKVV